MVGRIAEKFPGHRCRIERLRTPWLKLLSNQITHKGRSSRKKIMLSGNLDRFRALDVLVVPERTSVRLVARHGLTDLKMIHTRHGAGDREGSYDNRLRLFDLVLVPGPKSARWLLEHKLVDEDKIELVGYSKFDAFRNDQSPALFPERLRHQPTVLYNPHFHPSVTSWDRLGRKVIEFFVANPQWNLIYSPHVELTRWSKYGGRPRSRVPLRARRAENIVIDRGTPRALDLTYSRVADFYMGDASSQVYEFIQSPRPCLFLDAHETDWEGHPHFLHWNLGEVIRDVEKELGPALERAQDLHADRYADRQAAALADTFYTRPGQTAASVGAEAVARFLTEAERG